MYKTVRGLVLREVRYKESSKILTLLTEEEGKLTAEARGALRRGSRCAAASQQLTFSELTLWEARGRHVLTEAAVLEDFSALRQRLEDLALGVYFAELLEAVADEDSHDPALLRLGLNALFALARQLYPPEHIKAVFELRLLCLAGFAPELTACPGCGAVDMDRPRFALAEGGAYCAACAPPGKTLSLCAASLAAMRHVSHADAKKIFSFTLDDSSAAVFRRVCQEYALWQLDRRFPSLDYWISVKG